MKVPTITTNKQKYFLQYLTIINPILLRLSPMQLKVFAGILYWNNELKQHPIDLRNRILFSSATKKVIRESIIEGDKVMGEGNFNNLIKELRRKKLINGKGSETILNNIFAIYPDKDLTLTINWKIE